METSDLTVGSIKASAGLGLTYFGLSLDQWTQVFGICLAAVSIIATLPAAISACKKLYAWMNSHGSK